MKKLSIILALLLVVCFVTGAVAEDRLKWTGAYRARAWYKDSNSNFNTDDNSDRLYYIDQRLRNQVTIAVAEGITAVARFDLGEVTWGNNTTGSRSWARPDADADSDSMFQLDRSYVRIDKEMFTVSVGQQFMALGKSFIWEANQFGANLRVKLPVDLYAQYAKIDENGANTDEDFNNSNDVDFYGGQAIYKKETWSVGVLAAGINDASTTDNSPYAFGVFGDATFGALMIQGEFDYFDGDNGAGDFFGSQVWIGGKYTVTPAFWVGLDGWYAASTSNPNKTQMTSFSANQSVNFDDIGPLLAEIVPLRGIAGAVGGTTSARAEMDPAGTNSGAIGGVLSAGYRIIEPLNLQASLLYVTPESTSNTILNNAFVGNIFLNYDWYENTQVAAGYVYTGIDVDGASTDGSNILVLRLQLKF